MASENRLIISGLTLSDIPEEEEVEETIDPQKLNLNNLEIRLQVIGDYPAIKSFILDLYQARRIFVIKDIRFKVNEENRMETLSATLNLDFPFLDPRPKELDEKSRRR